MRFYRNNDVVRKFIDAKDWKAACSKFPQSPWKYYIKPSGQYSSDSWLYFRRAVKFIEERSMTAVYKNGLKLHDVVVLNSILLHGKPQRVKSYRQYQVVYTVRSFDDIERVFKGVNYFNSDGLKIRVEGFWPVSKNSLSIFSARKEMKEATGNGSFKKCAILARSIKRMLYLKVDRRSKDWVVYFLIDPEERERQARRVLEWYNKKENDMLVQKEAGKYVHLMDILKLAVKMQRYMDMAHYCRDASSRTSCILRDYICLRLGIAPPQPVLFKFRGKLWENGTYLSLDEALEMARQGLI